MSFILKLFFDSILYKLYLLKSILDELVPSKIICFIEPEEREFYNHNFEIGDIIPKILQILKNRYKYELITYKINELKEDSRKEPYVNNRWESIKQSIIFMLKNKIEVSVQDHDVNLRNVGIVMVGVLKKIVLYTKYRLNKNPKLCTIVIGRNNTLARILLYVSGWGKIGGTVKSIARIVDNCKVIPTEIENSTLPAKFGITKRTLKDFWKKLSSSQSFKNYFYSGEVDFSSVISPYLEKYICSIFPTCVVAGGKIERELSGYKASVYITPTIDTTYEIAAVLACKRLGIKVCSVQHGSMGYFKTPIIKYMDYIGTDYTFTYGSGVADFFLQEFKDNSMVDIAVPIPVGNPILKELFVKCRRKPLRSNKLRRQALYVDTHFISNLFYFGWNCYPNIWYSRLQRRLVDVFKGFQNIKLYIKPYPSQLIENPLIKYINDNDINNVIFLPHNVDMVEFIDMTDLFIIDFPTTSLLKMVCSRKPIIAYYNPDYFKLSLEARKLLEKRAELCNTEDGYFTTIEKYCKDLDWSESENPDDEFLFRYGICGENIDTEKMVVDRLADTIINQGVSR
ncbi:MAG: hypothetical protein SCABRO_03632 [Candidatus Scalindua brodae]|uniref:CDP-Glycerol:Poly(Glycerophosphate) glycerophosphotransferase n=1 Tax=Candidatus Scalindua brodae TaxID=237368 RepID=A0A0B0ED61_9BACT|nr:MAG: hypothetical protein SCABRO_03632 [Candidatus Scalindua brodae]